MRHLKTGIPILGSAAILLALAGCADENPWGSSSDQKGCISLSLTTDSEIKTAKPVFRSGEEESANDPNDLNTYIEVPTPDEFSIKLEKSSDGTVSSWASLTDFKEYIANNQFDTGTYTLTAYYGEQGKQDFESPYFEASTTFNVLSDQDNEISLTAELKNSMVKINYTDGFKNYMKDYHAKVRTEGIGEPITYGALETRPLFIEPKNANLTVHFTTKGKEYTSDAFIGDFPPLAKTLHNITFDISENATSGDATLNVIFSDELEEENISIDLAKFLETTPAPVIECYGFENGQTLDMLEGNAIADVIKMTAITTSNPIASAILTIESANYTPGWGKEIDLCNATSAQQTQIKNAGIDAVGFGFEGKPTDLIGILTLTDFCKSLPTGSHKVSLLVTDSKGKVSETASVTFDSQEITLERVDEATIGYASNMAELLFDYNGANPLQDLYFAEEGATGYVQPTSVIEQPTTRASEKKRYLITIPLSNTVRSSVDINASYKQTKSLGNFNVTVELPEYDIVEYDAFSQYAYAKVITTDPSALAAVVANIKLKNDDSDLTISNREVSNGYGVLTITGLTPSTEKKSCIYNVKSSIVDGEWLQHDVKLITEKEQDIPNGDFSKSSSNLESEGTLLLGGNWYASRTKSHRHYSTFFYKLPESWSSINNITAPSKENVTNYNTWYVVPSSWTENEVGVMRNVGYNHNGKELGDSPGTNTDHYCRDHPENSDLEKAAGVLALGDYNFTTGKSEGIDFFSRPSKITFDYEYNNDPDKIKDEFKEDVGYAYIQLFDLNGKSLGVQEFDIEKGSGSKTISFENYRAFQATAGKLIIVFKSSNNSVPPIHIPTGDELSEGDNKAFDISDKTFPANQYHAVATGSILKIDNVTAHYSATPNAAPAAKPSTKKRK